MNRRIKGVATFLVILQGIFSVNAQTGLFSPTPTARFRVKVVDENGKPLPNIPVRGGFSLPYNGWSDSFKGYSQNGKTRSDGTVSFEGKTTGDTSWSIRLPGYYATVGSKVFSEVEGGKWQPWDSEIEAVLKPIVKPIPLYARKVDAIAIPEFGKEVGFDLIESDWVQPYGKGKIVDLFFRMDREFTSAKKPFFVALAITFPNPGDGILKIIAPPREGSELKLQRMAPIDGYGDRLDKKTVKRTESSMIEEDYSEKNNYFIRTRVVEKEGKIVLANYGKIYGDIEYYENGRIRFTYYFNPTPNDKNLEFAKGKSLIQDLHELQEPYEP